jgi:hypothetical protein
VGLPKNLKADLGDQLDEYECVLTKAGKDGEVVYQQRRSYANR